MVGEFFHHVCSLFSESFEVPKYSLTETEKLQIMNTVFEKDSIDTSS